MWNYLRLLQTIMRYFCIWNIKIRSNRKTKLRRVILIRTSRESNKKREISFTNIENQYWQPRKSPGQRSWQSVRMRVIFKWALIILLKRLSSYDATHLLGRWHDSNQTDRPNRLRYRRSGFCFSSSRRSIALPWGELIESLRVWPSIA